MNESERFWSKVDKSSECWEWTSAVTDRGYGHFKLCGPRRTVRAHRWAYAASIDEPLESLRGVVIRHTCDNPGCVRPDHLLPGTHKNNAQDRENRGRSRPLIGESHPRSKLSDGQTGTFWRKV
ncbi:hypothetical protein LCGC14_2356310 [marine sediment metagenome]|uniref:Uncharacterized protein n=1 Tax=marine sediment metagenome TaxID=412755 RepID=A0A0F9CV67_9ZZZZ